MLAEAPGGAAVELRGARKVHGAGSREVVALAGVDLTVARGSVVAIVGPSGSGKSTILHLMGGLETPSAGIVRVLGRDLAALSDDARTRLRRDHIGFVFQFFNLMPTLSALENVLLPSLLAGAGASRPRAKGTRWAELESRARAGLEAVGLADRAEHRPDQLSGGEMQRVAIARALLNDPELLLADEPTGNLDTRSGEEVLELLLGARSARRTLMFVTHDPRVAARADRLIEVRDGRVEADRSTALGLRPAIAFAR